ncbi:MAG: sigma-E processing peptidase SpoIIGA [Christensenellales bacterium]|jgi:sigma-E processing peptidase SpoIIGA
MRLQKVYIELIFIDNFIINLLIIHCTSVLTKVKKQWGRYVCSAAVGGVYASAVFGTSGFAVSVIAKVAVSFAMCCIAFYIKKERSFLKNICTFYVTTFVFAGSIYACMFCFGDPVTYGTSIVVRPFLRYILLGCVVGAVLIGVFGRIRKRLSERERISTDVVLIYGSRKVYVRAYIDTGNMLTEPLTGYGVVLITKGIAKALFDNDTIDLMLCRGITQTDRLRIIACTTAIGESVLYGIEIDRIELRGANTATKAVVCVAKGTLAGGYGAIVGNIIMDDLLKGAQNEKVSGTQDNHMDFSPAGNDDKRRLYQRKRSTSTTADTTGRDDAVAIAGERRQVG